MDLYDALKAGTSADDLLKQFHKELDAAKTRIKQEEDNARFLDAARYNLAEAIVDYVDAWLGPDGGADLFISDAEEVVDMIKNMETEAAMTTLILDDFLDPNDESKDKDAAAEVEKLLKDLFSGFKDLL